MPKIVGFDIFAARNAQAEQAKPQEPVTVWPENLRPLEVFLGLGTQWRADLAGLSGLDYGAAWLLIDRLYADLSAAERRALFTDVQVMERETLKVISEARAREKTRAAR